MKKLLVLGMVGAMVLGMQSMVFANNEKAVPEKVEAATMIPAQEVEGAEGIIFSVPAEIRELTAEELASAQELVKEICTALDIEYSETMTLEDVLSGLTEAQMEELVKQGIMGGMAAATETVAVEIDGEVEGEGDGMITATIITSKAEIKK